MPEFIHSIRRDSGPKCFHILIYGPSIPSLRENSTTPGQRWLCRLPGSKLLQIPQMFGSGEREDCCRMNEPLDRAKYESRCRSRCRGHDATRSALVGFGGRPGSQVAQEGKSSFFEAARLYWARLGTAANRNRPIRRPEVDREVRSSTESSSLSSSSSSCSCLSG